MSIKETMENAFEQYAGMTIVDRAICDARDMLKPSVRMSIYAQYLEKITSGNPYKKSQKSVAAAMDHFYVHGDMSLYPMLARLGKPFAMRYVLEDFQGNTGTIEESANEAASRYTEMRLGKITEHLFEDIEKETITKWFDNYTGEEQYPAVLPSKGYYNIVNGTSGIATGLASSIPQFNLREVNTALIKLLNNPDINDDEIICMPDFAGGGILLNASEVRESLLHGTGFSCKLRSKVEYDKKGNRLIITETPYGVYTKTILRQLMDIAQNDDENPGIDRPLDFSTTKANIEIELNKKANVDKVIKYLYKNTSIQYHYPINMTMLDNGKVPKVFTWREALQAHLNHEKEVYRRGYEFDIRKMTARKHILNGYLICLARIEEVVQTIKKSESTAMAKSNLIKEYLLDDAQATAVLKLTLSRLAHMEVKKIEQEKETIIKEIARLEAILADEKLLNAEIEKGLRAVMNKYGDERRTTILDVEKDNEETIEVKQLQLMLTNKNNVIMNEASSLYTQKRGGVGAKTKFSVGEFAIENLIIKNTDTILFFAKNGNFYPVSATLINLDEKIAIETLTGCAGDEIVAMTSMNKRDSKPFIIFLTKHGYLKKSNLSEYNVKRTTGVKSITLEEDDEIVNVLFTDKDQIAMLTVQGNFVMVDSVPIRPIGRIARGIKGIKLNDGDYVISARCIRPSARRIVSVTTNGNIKQTDIEEFAIQGTNTKGSKIQKLTDNDTMADFLPINDHAEIFIASTGSYIKIATKDIPVLSRGAQGVIGIKLNNNNKVVALS